MIINDKFVVSVDTETDAYKNMLSGTTSMRRQPSSGPDDTDDDVEKQIATVLTQKPKYQ